MEDTVAVEGHVANKEGASFVMDHVDLCGIGTPS